MKKITWIFSFFAIGLIISSPCHAQWAISYRGWGYDGAYSIQQTSDLGYIVAGRTDSFGPETSTGTPVASDLAFGHRFSNANNIAIARVDIDRDGVDELAVIREKTDGNQRLFIFNAPPRPETSTGTPVASDLAFGHRSSNANNIAIARIRR